MVQSKAETVEGYLAELPGSRRAAMQAVRQAILDSLPQGYEEEMQYGMIAYVVPLARYPKGYLDNPAVPVCYAALAAQKNHLSLYLMNVYGNKEIEADFKQAWKVTGKKLDMGKSCIRFTTLDVPQLDIVRKAIARTSVDEYIAQYEASRSKR